MRHNSTHGNTQLSNNKALTYADASAYHDSQQSQL